MDSSSNPLPHCAQEALDLLNCAAASPYDQDRCLRLLQSLRQCILEKRVKKFSLSDKTGTRTTDNTGPKEKGM